MPMSEPLYSNRVGSVKEEQSAGVLSFLGPNSQEIPRLCEVSLESRVCELELKEQHVSRGGNVSESVHKPFE